MTDTSPALTSPTVPPGWLPFQFQETVLVVSDECAGRYSDSIMRDAEMERVEGNELMMRERCAEDRIECLSDGICVKRRILTFVTFLDLIRHLDDVLR